jgi:hypothetical protein
MTAGDPTGSWIILDAAAQAQPRPGRSPRGDGARDAVEEGTHGGTMGSPVRSAGRLNAPRPVLVEQSFDGTPREVNRRPVALVREEWRVVDRWWTEEPVERRYFEVVLEGGENTVVYRDEEAGGWFTQRG